MRALTAIIAVATAALLPAQALRVDHFVQRGATAEAALCSRTQSALRLCGGGIAGYFGDSRPPCEVIQQLLQCTDAVAAAAADLPFWAAVSHDRMPLVATNVRDRDGQPIGAPFLVKQAGPLRLALFAIVARDLPAGFTAVDATTAIRANLLAAQQVSDAAIVIVDGDLAAGRALLQACPDLAGAIVTAEPGADDHPLAVDDRFLVQSPQSSTAVGELALTWNGKVLRANGHRFSDACLDAYGLQQQARLRAALAPVVGAEDDAGITARGLAGCGIEPAAIDAAIARGAAFLGQELANDRDGRQPLGYANDHVLMALALVHAGVAARDPEFDAALRQMLRQREVSTLGVYSAGVYCMLIEAYGHPEFYGHLRAAARYLVEGQSASGSWTYQPKVDPTLCNDPDRRVLQVTGGEALHGEPEPVTEWQRAMPWNAHDSGDNSITQFALLGLRAAQTCSVPVPRATWERAAGWYRRGQRQGGGFGYDGHGSDAYGSMTLAGVCGLAITAHELGNAAFASDLQVRQGLQWLREHFAIDSNPEHGSNLYYYLYSLERTGRIFDRELLCGQEWYPLGVRQLLAAQQQDGSWDGTKGGESQRLATSFALLFLTRATVQLQVERKHGGSGRLVTFAKAAPGARIYVILDASGSMLEETGGRSKFDLARAAVEDVLAALPPGPQVALRAYGHRKRAIEVGADEDTELLVPMGAFDRDAFLGKLRALRARGKTPLTRSLREAAAELGNGSGPTTVVLLTDGGEDTMPRKDPVAAAAALGKLAGLELHVVGFDIKRDDWRAQLRAMAQAGHGGYWPADSKDLGSELRAAVLKAPDGFSLHADDGGEVARGRFGEQLQLPEGRYRLTAVFGGKEFATQLWINTDATTAVVFDGIQALSVQPPAVGPQCPACHQPAAANARFCPACGVRMPGR